MGFSNKASIGVALIITNYDVQNAAQYLCTHPFTPVDHNRVFKHTRVPQIPQPNQPFTINKGEMIDDELDLIDLIDDDNGVLEGRIHNRVVRAQRGTFNREPPRPFQNPRLYPMYAHDQHRRPNHPPRLYPMYAHDQHRRPNHPPRRNPNMGFDIREEYYEIPPEFQGL
ncbi:hypothetical protein TVAGG3_0405410 [Trichomonas vaginalis G3]|uniref:hypothetical protein n=1 Tax=Trichomonas vaginalis (strain ATCC PRA-98 / G3) TaxID=412133 RepID=UPI0021E60701|nr:hypothetical protein TVAGG3_0405410 [Trichomonas vaginalis G3]KAI5534993.1 hypothetical protein TVAGG3_0405410 [Trichomonas vaginalis G3]